MITKIDHVGVAVRDLEATVRFYQEILGIQAVGREVVEEQKVTVAFLPLGESEIELLESTDPQGPIAKFIENRGEGIQHLALRVDDLDATLEQLRAQGVRLIDEKPRYGAGGARIAFVHPKATMGTLLELCERK